MMQCAAAVEFDNPRLKLTLLKFAESARDTDRVALPGYDPLRQWVGVGDSQLHNLINQLIELQFLARLRRASRGRRMEYLLFPNGCCEVHGKRPAQVVDDGGDVVTLAGESVAVGSSAEVESTALSTDRHVHARPVDPTHSDWVHSTGRLGPVGIPIGSTPPVDWVQSARSESAASLEPSKNPPNPRPPETPHLVQPLPPRDTSDVDIDFSRMDPPGPPRGVRVAPPNGGRALGCRHCDAGFICDGDGTPVAKCPHCHPAHRHNRNEETA